MKMAFVREFSVYHIIGRSFEIYISRFKRFILPYVLVSLGSGAIQQLISLFIPPFILPDDFTENFFSWLIDYSISVIPLIGLFGVLNGVLLTLAFGLAVKSTSNILEKKTENIEVEIRLVFSRILPLLSTGFIVSSLTVLGLILLLIPGIFIAVIFSLTIQSIVIENQGVVKSLQQSRRFVSRNWWGVFSVFFIVMVLSLGTVLLGLTLGNSVASYDDTFGWLVSSFVGSLPQLIYPIALTIIHHALKNQDKSLQPKELQKSPVSRKLDTIRQLTPTFLFQPIFCYKCGQRLPLDANYCPLCGIRTNIGP